jgi:hypothetical protein
MRRRELLPCKKSWLNAAASYVPSQAAVADCDMALDLPWELLARDVIFWGQRAATF